MATWADDVEVAIRARLGETALTGFWTTKDLQTWYNDGGALFHRGVWNAYAQQDRDGFNKIYESDYLEQFLEMRSGVMRVGIQDYDLPSNFWKIARVVVGASPPINANQVSWTDDWQVRLGGRLGPRYDRPLYAIIPNVGKQLIRFYIEPGDRTIPNLPLYYSVHYWRTPIPVNTFASPPVDVEIKDPYNDGPIAWACYCAFLKEREDGSIFKEEFERTIATVAGGFSQEIK